MSAGAPARQHRRAAAPQVVAAGGMALRRHRVGLSGVLLLTSAAATGEIDLLADAAVVAGYRRLLFVAGNEREGRELLVELAVRAGARGDGVLLATTSPGIAVGFGRALTVRAVLHDRLPVAQPLHPVLLAATAEILPHLNTIPMPDVLLLDAAHRRMQKALLDAWLGAMVAGVTIPPRCRPSVVGRFDALVRCHGTTADLVASLPLPEEGWW